MDELEVLQAQIAEMQKKAEALASHKKAEVSAEIRAKIKAYGLTPKDLGFDGKSGSTTGSTVAIKYRLNDQTWTGRGRQPKFVVDYIASGGKLEDIAV